MVRHPVLGGQADELKKLAKWAHTGRMFDMPELTVKGRTVLQEVRTLVCTYVCVKRLRLAGLRTGGR